MPDQVVVMEALLNHNDGPNAHRWGSRRSTRRTATGWRRDTSSTSFNCRLNLNADIEWQGGHPDGTSSVPPAIVEYFDKKVQTAVDDLWMIGKIWCAFTIPNTRPTRKTLSRLPTSCRIAASNIMPA